MTVLLQFYQLSFLNLISLERLEENENAANGIIALNKSQEKFNCKETIIFKIFICSSLEILSTCSGQSTVLVAEESELNGKGLTGS